MGMAAVSRRVVGRRSRLLLPWCATGRRKPQAGSSTTPGGGQLVVFSGLTVLVQVALMVAVVVVLVVLVVLVVVLVAHGCTQS